MHFPLQELQDAVGTTVGAGVNLTGQLTRAAVPVAQGIVASVREILEEKLLLKRVACFAGELCLHFADCPLPKCSGALGKG